VVMHALTNLQPVTPSAPVQRSASAPGPALAPPIVHDVLRSAGMPLDAATRAEMEPRFRHSFADVRIHADGQAAASARAVGAHAYTVGRDVVFGAGRYAPASAEGRRLMAHELAHVVQQSGASTASIHPRLEVGAVDDPAEREADRAADAVLRGGAGAAAAWGGRIAEPLVQRQKEDGTGGRPRDGTLPYREATELTRCMQIMGPDAGAYCRQTVLGEAGPAGPATPRKLRIVLENVGIVRPRAVVEQTIIDAFHPAAVLAGREIELAYSPPGDAELTFDRGGRATRPCGLMILGNEGGGDIFVGAHADLRVCGTPEMDPATGGVDHASPRLEHVFDPAEPAFGRFVGGTAVHELGHVMAQLPHTADRGNYMHSEGSLGANLPEHLRTLETMRRHWGGTKTFSGSQIRLLAQAMMAGPFKGGMKTQGVP
jgi:hypothetical protein